MDTVAVVAAAVAVAVAAAVAAVAEEAVVLAMPAAAPSEPEGSLHCHSLVYLSRQFLSLNSRT